ncbi:Glyoxalase/Bleomycin resistance protein/Dihydroxybiphenyl dioxygenase [Cucurbitaria berberidis CBS 394.84]|uniref:Glyoxalase/Bleomycin resistance protein/Dihydroxybiphenyl dioxygenase n=1 Tax=Cucurbitaria berberidis CBS 394.84 TaxID=1168544 RepID=A0A9P4GKZ1_9PLEO|nr:Glyoxalase/Bleomycin resistance protein/Dihydroxybiphenyl dioxygenase [Cucurbitaria berberidis CBS 394.84]KAF1847001.1 Glyoxalase/Bleomycin resistance protein/Dihydroxybiphenyl dioxygenase [Cucurbitaria berberidis CBS 394.84]
MPPIHSHVVNHIAISVPDCDSAVEWYAYVFGFKKIRSDKLINRSANADAPIFRLYGNTLQKVKIAYLSTGNNVGLEIFEFIDPPHQPVASSSHFEYTRAGVFHICFTTPDVDEAMKRVLEKGGTQVGETVEVGKEVDGSIIKVAYVKDPWGTVLEMMSCSFERLMANKE